MLNTTTQAQARPVAAGDLLAALERVALATLPPLFAIWTLFHWLPSTSEGVDFWQLYAGGWHLLRGADIYTQVGAFGQRHAFVYPPLSAVVFAPITIFGLHAASVIFGVTCLALVPLTLRVMEVRDWRIYAITLAWAPVAVAWQTGNETSMLLLLMALLWRSRDRPAAAGLVAAVAISLKLFMWPLALWLLATRRWRAGVCGLACGVVINAICWALAGFGNIAQFLHQSNLDVGAYWRLSYSVAGTLNTFGVSHGTGSLLTLLASLALGLAVLYCGYLRGRDSRALTLTVILILVASPIVWNHYFLLLLVPLAVARPRFTWLWTVPVCAWACPYYPALQWQRPLAWALATIIAVALMCRPVTVSLPGG